MLFELKNSESFKSNIDYKEIHEIKVIDSLNLSYDFFFQNFLLLNKPCIIQNVSTKWKCSQCWLTNNEINRDYLLEKYGSDLVCIHNCNERYYNSQKSKILTFREYLSEGNISNIFPKGEYLKNWHLKLNYPDDDFYEVPIFFASDWLNEFYIENTDDDYRFVYMGSDGTWTPFHADVFSSFSWSVNVIGQKKWILLPPGEEEYLKDKLSNLPYDLNMDDLHVKYFEIIQNPGEALFVPSGWHHQVWNLGDTVSVNHNWVNGCNIQNMFEAMIKSLAEIKNEIKDCNDMDDFHNHCQIMLNALFGIDFKKFYKFLKYIALKRIIMYKDQTARHLFHGHLIGENHILFDLKVIKDILEKFIYCEENNFLEIFDSDDVPPDTLIKNISAIL